MIIVDYQNCFMFVLLCFFSYFLFFRKRKDSKIDFKLPPSPPSLPIIGHLHLVLSGLLHKSFQNIATKHGPLLLLRIFGYPVLLVTSPTVAYEIYKKHDLKISSRWAPSCSDSILFGSTSFVLAPYGDYWKFMNKLLATKLLRPQAIAQSRDVRAEELGRFYLNLVDKAMKKECVEMGKEVMKLTNNVICRMIMGRSCSTANGEAERVLELVLKTAALTKKVIIANVFGGLFEKLGISLFKKYIMSVSHEFDEFLERFLVEHEEKLEEHKDMHIMGLLLEAYRDEKAEYKITRMHIKSLLVDIFLASTESIARTTQWTMAELINNPNVLQKLRAEIDTVVGKTRLIQETDLPNLPYLQAVIKEGLRLYPAAALVLRPFEESVEVNEFYIPENTTLVINLYAVMRDPNVWEDPLEFKPERFLISSEAELEDEMREQGMKYIPFGFGRRGCPASHIAKVFLGNTIGTMVQCFDWRIQGDKVRMVEHLQGINLVMAHPLMCTPVVRIDPSTFTH